MSITLNLSPEAEEKLTEDAERIGIPAEALINHAVEDILLNRGIVTEDSLNILHDYPGLNQTTKKFLRLLRLVQFATMFSPLPNDPRFQDTAQSLSELFGYMLQISMGEAKQENIAPDKTGVRPSIRLTATLEREELSDGTPVFVAFCPEIDIASQGDTEQEALMNLNEAVAFFMEDVDDAELGRRLRTALTAPELLAA